MRRLKVPNKDVSFWTLIMFVLDIHFILFVLLDEAHSKMSSAPFNPMRKTPPPPPYIDTVELNPEDYVSVCPSDGSLSLVHRECLRMSPFIRRAFEKRVNISLPDVEISFIQGMGDDDDDELEVHSHESLPPTTIENGEKEESAIENMPIVETQPNDEKKDEEAETGAPAKKKQETIFPEDPLYAIPKVPKPVEVYKETLRNDPSVLIQFPNLKSSTLDVVIAYLYYKNRYEGQPQEPREDFSVPAADALTIMKLAALLEC